MQRWSQLYDVCASSNIFNTVKCCSFCLFGSVRSFNLQIGSVQSRLTYRIDQYAPWGRRYVCVSDCVCIQHCYIYIYIYMTAYSLNLNTKILRSQLNRRRWTFESLVLLYIVPRVKFNGTGNVGICDVVSRCVRIFTSWTFFRRS
jgi:hypothetical protein